MSGRAAENSKDRSNWRHLSILILVLTGLVAVASANNPGANASASFKSSGLEATGPGQAIGAGDNEASQKERSQSRVPFRSPLLGADANPPAPVSSSSTSSGKDLPGDQGGRYGPDLVFPNLGSRPAQPGASGTAAPAAPVLPAPPTCAPEWSVVTTPNDELNGDYLAAVAEVGPADIWAAGVYFSDTTAGVQRPFFEHWDGTSWSVVAAPLPAGGTGGSIIDISVNSTNDIWAVGNYIHGAQNDTLIERWNGLQWSPVAGANPSTTDNILLGVAVVSTNNVWAVGYYNNGTLHQTLVEQWDGTSWSQVSSPNHGTGANELFDVAVVPGSSGNNMWAVGYYTTSTNIQETQTLHYYGGAWHFVTSADTGTGNNQLTGVTAISAGDVWAVGSYDTATPGMQNTLAEHWDGTAWTTSPTANPGAGTHALFKVFATSSSDVWAVGNRDTSSSVSTTLIEHWNGTAWSVSSSTPPGAASQLIGITGSTSSDLWTVGVYRPSLTTDKIDVLTEHYDGTQWSVVYGPEAPSSANIFYSVSANSATDIWAAGYSSAHVSGTPVSQGVLEHWNGTAWSLATSAHPTTHGDQLFAVKAISANDVWAVGNTDNATNEQTLIEHWNGTTWTQVPSPNPGGSSHDNALVGIDAATANDIWAVGYYNGGTPNHTLILHWNGSSWTQFSSPSPGAYDNSLADVTVVPGSGGTDAWAVGQSENTSTGSYSNLFERWNGTSWSVVTSPDIGGGTDNLPNRIFALAANDVWAVGSTNDSSSHNQNLALHWDGTAWTISPIVQQGSGNNILVGVTGNATHNVYAVGQYVNAGGQPQPLMEHWNGSAWSVVPNIPSPGSAAALTGMVIFSSANMWTVGGYLPTGFPDSQMMAQHFFPCLSSCTITFSDVPAGSTFYPYIHCLACLGIINGYPDGTFKPNANVTRGQLSKIIANSAGFSDIQTAQMFQDVPVGSTYFQFIGRLASRGYISGYSCGGPNEPCMPPGNLPYFRPNANATRGQISKIDSNAAGFNDTPNGQQFQDVGVGSTYYDFIYRLASRSIMSGYACGGTNEPCVPPGNLPYFRPNNDATRGQTSKIVSGTFFPDCSSPDAVTK